MSGSADGEGVGSSDLWNAWERELGLELLQCALASHTDNGEAVVQ